MSLLILCGTTKSLANTSSAINKVAITGPIYCSETGLEDDQQTNLKVHGGKERALHYYPREHYEYWRTFWHAMELPLPEGHFQPGTFGENLSDHNLNEDNCCIGDTFSLGETIIQISQPRSPCGTLNLHLNYPATSILMQANGRTGWLFRVLQEGYLETGQKLTLIDRPYANLTVKKCLNTLYNQSLNIADLEQLITTEALSPNWRKKAQLWLESGKPSSWKARLTSY